MIASRAEAAVLFTAFFSVPRSALHVGWRCAAVLLIALAAPGGHAVGQDQDIGSPIRILPQPAPSEVPGPLTDTDVEAEEPDVRTDTSPSGIEVNPLAELSLETLGVLDENSGGLGLDLWRGSTRTTIERLIRRMPSDSGSPTLRDLAVRVLLSNARAPNSSLGRNAALADDRDPAGLISARIEALFALGAIEGLNALFAVVPQRIDNEELARVRVYGQLLAGQSDRACQMVRNNVIVYPAAPFWPKALIYCQILADEGSQANLGIDLLREQGTTQDEAFLALTAFWQGGGKAKPLEAQDLSPLHFAMLRHLDYPETPEGMEGAAPWLLSAIASDAEFPLEQRTAAAEMAVAAGSLEPETLGEIYATYEFTPEQRNTALSSAPELPPRDGRALLFQAAQAQSVAAAKAEVLRAALELARRDGGYRSLAPVLAPSLEALRPSQDLNWVAPTAGRALYATGRPEAGSSWYRRMTQPAAEPERAEATLNALWPYSRLSGEAVQRRNYSLQEWKAAREDGDYSEELADQQALLLVLFTALGESDSLTWAEVAAADSQPDRAMAPASVIYALREASAAGRLGETILLSLVAVGKAGLSAGHPLVLGEVVAALSQVGLTAEAHAIAREAAVASDV